MCLLRCHLDEEVAQDHHLIITPVLSLPACVHNMNIQIILLIVHLCSPAPPKWPHPLVSQHWGVWTVPWWLPPGGTWPSLPHCYPEWSWQPPPWLLLDSATVLCSLYQILLIPESQIAYVMVRCLMTSLLFIYWLIVNSGHISLLTECGV